MLPQISLFQRTRSRGQDSNNLLELTKPQLEGIESGPEDLLRWEDDGGQTIIARGKDRDECHRIGMEEHL